MPIDEETKRQIRADIQEVVDRRLKDFGIRMDTAETRLKERDRLDIVYMKGAQIIAGIKTFLSFLITPSSAPTTDYQVANKKYVDDNKGMTNPMSSSADLIYGGASGVPTRLAGPSSGSFWRVLALNPTGYMVTWMQRMETFLVLTDTPALYTGQAGKYLRVNSGEDAVEFFAVSFPASYAAGDNLIISSDDVVNENGVTYAKGKGIRIDRSGVIRIKFDLACSSPPGNGSDTIAYGRIYINGVATGTERTVDNGVSGGDYVNFSEDITVSEGDLVQLYLKKSGVHNTFARNYRFYVDNTYVLEATYP